MSAKGYVVRGTAPGDVLHEEARDTLHAAVSTWTALVMNEAARPRIFAVADDGTEAPLPSYEEALAEIVRIDATLATTRRDEHRRADDTVADRVDSLAAALAVADADMYRVREVLGCKVEEETHAVAERLLTEIERCVDALKGATK
jgi:hypothetical protein